MLKKCNGNQTYHGGVNRHIRSHDPPVRLIYVHPDVDCHGRSLVYEGKGFWKILVSMADRRVGIAILRQ